MSQTVQGHNLCKAVATAGILLLIATTAGPFSESAYVGVAQAATKGDERQRPMADPGLQSFMKLLSAFRVLEGFESDPKLAISKDQAKKLKEIVNVLVKDGVVKLPPAPASKDAKQSGTKEAKSSAKPDGTRAPESPKISEKDRKALDAAHEKLVKVLTKTQQKRLDARTFDGDGGFDRPGAGAFGPPGAGGSDSAPSMQSGEPPFQQRDRREFDANELLGRQFASFLEFLDKKIAGKGK